ncbi:MAG: NAD(P)-binding domain-containing protein [Ascidiaceihabitans sp.]|nr:NAD(P)-binding domain-containing protein [Ascidiaceihabitans sp.]
MTKQNVAVIGLGSMGLGIACSALRGAHRVWGSDPDPAQMTKFQGDGGENEPPIKVADILDVVVVVVLNAAQTEDVLFGAKGIVPALKKGAVVVSCATVPPAFARDMGARCMALGVHYLDAPISGGAKKSMNGQLSIMAAGSPDAFDAARPLLSSVSETLFDLGPEVGAGSAMKSVNQLLAGVHIATMAEAMTFGLTQGVTADKFIEVISKCAGTSWMLENRAPHVAAGDYTPHSSVNIWPKDLGIVLDIAETVNFDAPITTAALAQFKAAADMGLGFEDDAAVVKVYAEKSGLQLPKAK